MRRIHHPAQAIIPGIDDLSPKPKQRHRIMVSQLWFVFKIGINFTSVESKKKQRHPERLPGPIKIAVPTTTDYDQLKTRIRRAILDELENYAKRHCQHTAPESTPGSPNHLPGVAA